MAMPEVYIAFVAGGTKGILQKIKVSYKPQYLKSDSDEMVMVVLQDAIKKHTNDVINPLNIKPFFNDVIAR